MTPTDRKPTALVLTSDPAALHDASTALRRRGFAVLSAPDGVRGVELLVDHLLSLDVLVTDLELPGRDGAALVELVRVAGGERDLAIVVRCARSSPRVHAALLARGADRIVSAVEGAERLAAAAEDAIAARGHGDTSPARPPSSTRVAPETRRASSAAPWRLALPALAPA